VAQKIQVVLECDVCGDEKPATETITFGLDGTNYEIDVCGEHGGQLRSNLATFVGAGRRMSGGGGRRGRRSSGGGDRKQTQVIRAWAKDKGLKVSERGRISADIVQQYESAHR
jgi:hypothetical protein